MKSVLTIAQYYKLSEDDRLWYTLEYKEYKVRKFRKYEECDLGHTHYIGWDTESIPQGDPYRYKRVNYFGYQLAWARKMTQPAVIDSLNNSNVLMDRILNNARWNN